MLEAAEAARLQREEVLPDISQPAQQRPGRLGSLHTKQRPAGPWPGQGTAAGQGPTGQGTAGQGTTGQGQGRGKGKGRGMQPKLGKKATVLEPGSDKATREAERLASREETRRAREEQVQRDATKEMEHVARIQGGTVQKVTRNAAGGYRATWGCHAGHSFQASKDEVCKLGHWCRRCDLDTQKRMDEEEAAAEQQRMFAAARQRFHAKVEAARVQQHVVAPQVQAPLAPPGAPYTQEQVQLVFEVLQTPKGRTPLCMELPPGSTQQDIRRQFRRLASKLHPDKNKAPNSHEAFARISEAFQVLTGAG